MSIRIGPQSDEERTRRVEFNNIKYILKASDPYGFWKITCLKINKTLDGNYTAISEALKAAQLHSMTLVKKDK